jgi:uncharacterized peroxidase-related enzyme
MPKKRKSAQPGHVTALGIRPPPRARLDPDMQKYFAVCEEKIHHVPNVLLAYSAHGAKLRNLANFYNELMLGESPLSKLEREMIAVVVSCANHCYYCLVAHGAAVRQLSGDPVLGELLAMNYRAAELSPRHRAMLDFAHKLTVAQRDVGEADRQALRDAGFPEEAIWDIAEVAAFFNFTNRLATATDMMPNELYHSQAR